MPVGKKVIVKIPPDYAYGKKGTALTLTLTPNPNPNHNPNPSPNPNPNPNPTSNPNPNPNADLNQARRGRPVGRSRPTRRSSARPKASKFSELR